jgi:hypothetical protein
MEVDPELLQHRGLVLDDEHSRTQDVGRPVDLETRWEWRKAYLAPRAVARAAPIASVFQWPVHTIFNDN